MVTIERKHAQVAMLHLEQVKCPKCGEQFYLSRIQHLRKDKQLHCAWCGVNLITTSDKKFELQIGEIENDTPSKKPKRSTSSTKKTVSSSNARKPRTSTRSKKTKDS